MYRLLIFATVLLLVGGCVRAPQTQWTEKPTPDQLLERVQAVAGRFAALDAEASVGLTVEGKYRSTSQFLLVERPDRLRADVLSGFGQLLLQLASDGDTLSVHLNTTVPGRFLQGQASDANLFRYTRIPLPTSSLVRLVLYDPPLIEASRMQSLVVEGNLVLELSSGERRQQLIFDGRLQLAGCRYFADGLLLEVSYQDFSEKGFPQKLRFEFPREKTRVVLKLKDLQLNPEIARDKFRLRPPAGVTVEPLS